ncbi:hypothetical protein NMG60_11002796 [Bertholletia excelsa]
MEKAKLSEDYKWVKLPLGFRFQPTDEEIVFQYLASKVNSCSLPDSVVPEITVSKYDPWDLPADGAGNADPDRYFFTQKESKYQIGSRANRATRCGYWKATGSGKKITCSKRKDIMGMRKTLVFHIGKPPKGSRTDWIMHEYHLVNLTTSDSNLPQQASTQAPSAETEKWVLCHVFQKNGSRKIHNRDGRLNEEHGVSDVMRDMNASDTSSCSSSSSSCLPCGIPNRTGLHEDENTSSSTCFGF